MKRSFLNSKIHKATITGSDINYEGSCLIDISILNAA
ncbi:MAG: aspartate 1-decarboxylase, partial [Gammaproteobacteria bacterium]